MISGGGRDDVTVRIPYDRILARGVFAAVGAVLGLVLRYALGLALDPRFFWLLLAWYASVVAFFRGVEPRLHRPWRFPARFVFFGVEVLVAVGLARLLGASSWLAALFVLFPAVEWNMLYPRRWGLEGSVAAILAVGALVAGEAAGFIPPTALFRGIDPAAAEPGYAVAAFLIAGAVVLGLSKVVGNYAESGRRTSAELADVNRELRRVSADLRRSRQEVERAYAELRDAQAELVNSARMATLGTLVAGFAHEINTPLGALNGNHDLLRRALGRLGRILEDERVEEGELGELRRIVGALDGIMETNELAMERMKALVGSLRTFGRPDRAEVDWIDLHESLESTLQILRHELGEGIEVVRELGELPRIQCYPNQVNQVFMNLLLNAVQAMDGRGTLTLRTRAGDDRVEVEVEDTGCGIPEEHLERIFDPGFTTKGARVGMGLGLLITRRIVDRHGGELSVESRVGEGTTFTVTLPLRLPPEERPEAAAAPGAPAAESGPGEPAGSPEGGGVHAVRSAEGASNDEGTVGG